MAEERIHLAHRVNPYRTVCGRSIFGVSFLVAATARVTCERCKQWIARQEESEADS